MVAEMWGMAVDGVQEARAQAKRGPGSWMGCEEGQGYVGTAPAAGEGWAGRRGGASDMWGLRMRGLPLQ